MKPQAGQIKDIEKYLKRRIVESDRVEILAEGGSDNGETFLGCFVAKIGRKKYMFDNDSNVVFKLPRR